jgi:hypothetical protein
MPEWPAHGPWDRVGLGLRARPAGVWWLEVMPGGGRRGRREGGSGARHHGVALSPDLELLAGRQGQLRSRPDRRRPGRPDASSCIQTVEPWPSGSMALSSSSSVYPRTARQKPTSTASGFAAIASCTSCAPVRSATAPCARAIAETARASAMCRSSSPNTPRVSRTLRRPSAIVNTVPEPSRPGTCATASATCAASPSDGTRNTAVAPPCKTTQSSTPSAARNSRQPCSLMLASLYRRYCKGLGKVPRLAPPPASTCAKGRERSSAKPGAAVDRPGARERATSSRPAPR